MVPGPGFEGGREVGPELRVAGEETRAVGVERAESLLCSDPWQHLLSCCCSFCFLITAGKEEGEQCGPKVRR